MVGRWRGPAWNIQGAMKDSPGWLPDSWRIEMSARDGGCFYLDGSSTVRLSVLTFDIFGPNGPPRLRRTLRNGARVSGKRAGAVGDAGYQLEDNCVAVGVLAHAGRGLGDRPEQRPGTAPDLTAAGMASGW